jgi:hypothetical protein
MHLSSLEVRWFWKGKLEDHPDLKSAFEKFNPIPRHRNVGEVRWANPREDVYLVIPTAEDLGIKWREDELQTKGRRAVLGQVLFSNAVGLVEQWTKWSHEGQTAGAAFQPLFGGKGSAVKVWKQRALRKVAVDPTEPFEEVLDSEHIARGLNYELTSLKVLDEPYFSLAFEAFPDDSEMKEQFTSLVNKFLAGFKAEVFKGAESLGYPAWLDRLERVNP